MNFRRYNRFGFLATAPRCAAIVAATVLAAPLVTGSPAAAEGKESDYYQIITVPRPVNIYLEVGALDWTSDGRLALTTRRGDVYLVGHPDGETLDDVVWSHFAQGLHEPLGIVERDGAFYVTQRCEVTRLVDKDGDDRADVFDTVSDFWGIGGDYHEYAFGSKFDRHGDLWVVLCLTGSFTAESPFRGWCLRIRPDGTATPTCSGIRSPGGIGMNAAGDMFYTDNQGPWNGACSLKWLRPGAFLGHPAGNTFYALTTALGPRPADPESGTRLIREAARIEQLEPPAVYFPYQKMGQSASGIVCDQTGGRFGPFTGQFFIGDQTHSTVMRVCLEKVRGHYQGACFPFLKGFGSGSLALEFSPSGDLYVGGTNRGWGSVGTEPFALERVEWTGKTPLEIREMRVEPDGFTLTFTRPVDRESAADVASYRMETFTYIYQSNYGSPEVDRTEPRIERAEVAEDGRSVRLHVEGLEVGHVHELHLPGVRDPQGEPLLHPVAYYTLNYLPEGAK